MIDIEEAKQRARYEWFAGRSPCGLIPAAASPNYHSPGGRS
jgi:hypothetical protein